MTAAATNRMAAPVERPAAAVARPAITSDTIMTICPAAWSRFARRSFPLRRYAKVPASRRAEPSSQRTSEILICIALRDSQHIVSAVQGGSSDLDTGSLCIRRERSSPWTTTRCGWSIPPTRTTRRSAPPASVIPHLRAESTSRQLQRDVTRPYALRLQLSLEATDSKEFPWIHRAKQQRP